jgi:hypothetical protein
MGEARTVLVPCRGLTAACAHLLLQTEHGLAPSTTASGREKPRHPSPLACHPGRRAGVQGGSATMSESGHSGPPIKSEVTRGARDSRAVARCRHQMRRLKIRACHSVEPQGDMSPSCKLRTPHQAPARTKLVCKGGEASLSRKPPRFAVVIDADGCRTLLRYWLHKPDAQQHLGSSSPCQVLPRLQKQLLPSQATASLLIGGDWPSRVRSPGTAGQRPLTANPHRSTPIRSFHQSRGDTHGSSSRR